MSVDSAPDTQTSGIGPTAGVRAATGKRAWLPALGIIGVFLILALFCAWFYRGQDISVSDRYAADIAQIARNICDGKGFSTHFVRPFNLAFLSGRSDAYTELNHAPLYPYAMATMFRVRSASDQVAIWTSLAFLVAAVVATGLLGRILVDWRVGLLAATSVGVSAPVLKAGVSAQEWTMCMCWFSLLLIAVALHHGATLAGKRRGEFGWAIASALMLALLYMTNHILIALIVPLAAYFGVTGARRKANLAVFLVAAALFVAPWAARNVLHTGSVIGISAWDIMADTSAFPDDTLYRSTASSNQSLARALRFPLEHFSAFAGKLMRGTSATGGAILPMLGLVVLPFAVVGALYRFRRPTINAVRGLLYGAVPVLMVCFALYGINTQAVVMLAPAIAVLSAAYFLLLLDAKKLHPFFVRALIGGFVLVTAGPAIVSAAWPVRGDVTPGEALVERYLGQLGTMGKRPVVYTDVPWLYAWRTTGDGVWLPRSDDDIASLEAAGVPFRAVILTSESGEYSPEEMWYALHRVKLWREYIEDPEAAIKHACDELGISGRSKDAAMRVTERLKRSYAVSQSLKGFTTQEQDPLAPDDMQILVLD